MRAGGECVVMQGLRNSACRHAGTVSAFVRGMLARQPHPALIPRYLREYRSHQLGALDDFYDAEGYKVGFMIS